METCRASEGEWQPDARVLRLRYLVFSFDRRPYFTVAWGIAPGICITMDRLAEGHIQRASHDRDYGLRPKDPLFLHVLGRCP